MKLLLIINPRLVTSIFCQFFQFFVVVVAVEHETAFRWHVADLFERHGNLLFEAIFNQVGGQPCALANTKQKQKKELTSDVFQSKIKNGAIGYRGDRRVLEFIWRGDKSVTFFK